MSRFLAVAYVLHNSFVVRDKENIVIMKLDWFGPVLKDKWKLRRKHIVKYWINREMSNSFLLQCYYIKNTAKCELYSKLRIHWPLESSKQRSVTGVVGMMMLFVGKCSSKRAVDATERERRQNTKENSFSILKTIAWKLLSLKWLFDCSHLQSVCVCSSCRTEQWSKMSQAEQFWTLWEDR